MTQRTCVDCESTFAPMPGRGRPRMRCYACSPRRFRPTAPLQERVCWCGNLFRGGRQRKYCSYECRQITRMGTCDECGARVYRSKTSAQRQVCHPCRRSKKLVRPSVETHVCGDCERVWQRPPTKGQRPKRCPDCRVDDRQWIPAATRRAIYERDGWSCQICHEGVDRHLIGTSSEWRPSIDHVVPRSRGGTDDFDNLRLAHFWCNAVLNDGRAYSDDDFRHPVAV